MRELLFVLVLIVFISTGAYAFLRVVPGNNGNLLLQDIETMTSADTGTLVNVVASQSSVSAEDLKRTYKKDVDESVVYDSLINTANTLSTVK